jgi:signal transduction histidine kinase/ligand-binding sensor domain-containing protein/DNA-binding response OmpR family regulator
MLQAQTGSFYTTDRGLSSSLVNDIYQDSFGFIWASTEYGLNRFDGVKFSSFRHDNSNPSSLNDNFVHVVFEDAEKHLWVGGLTGMVQYRHASDTFERVAFVRGGKRVVANVTQIRQTKDGKIWITTSGQGLFVMGNQDMEAQSIEATYPKANPDYMACMLVDEKQKIWVGTEGSGLVMIDPSARHAEVYECPEFAKQHIQAVCKTEDGMIYLGTQTAGLVRFDPATGKAAKVAYAGSNPSNNIFSLAYVDGQLLVGTDGQGIKRYNPDKGVTEDYTNPHAPINMAHAKVHALMRDREDNLWVSVFQKGMARIPNQASGFTYYGSKSALGNPIGDACIMTLCRTQNGHLFVGADNDGLYELDADGNQVRHFIGGAAPSTVLSLMQDKSGQLWVGSFSQGVTRLNPATGQFTQLADSLKNSIVYGMTEGKDQNIYIAIFGRGILQYNYRNGDHKLYSAPADRKNDDQARDELTDNWINALFTDSNGLIWIGHYKGVSCFNPENESFLNINRRNSLAVGCVGYTFTEDTYGNVWAGTSDGLYRYNKKSGQITHFTEREGLADVVVCGLGHDDAGNVWASTYNGLSKYEAKANRFVNYYVGDGLQGNDFTHGANFTDREGNMYFGGPGGVTAIHPKQLQKTLVPEKVYLTDFYIHNHPIFANTNSGDEPIVDAPVPEATSINLAHYDNSFAIALSTMTYDHPDQIVYEYRIDEISEEWSTTESGVSRVSFHSLAPGDYTFRVRALDHGQNSEETVIPIHIRSPWYLSWWALCIYGVIGLLMIWMVISNLIAKARHQRDRMKNAHIEQLSEAKMQFFINISHEIRTPMTLIMSPVEKLLKQSTTPEAHQTYLLIYRNAQRILNLINQLLDIGKLDKGQMRMKFRETDLVAFIQDVMQPFEFQAKRKQIRFVFSHVSAHQVAWVDNNNFDKVLVNILSNAFKFTPDEGEITIRLQAGHDSNREDALADYIEISITDSGIGVEQDKLERIFERFYQADNELGAGQFGTGVGLHLTHSLVKMHHGEIHAENRENGSGTRFVIRIPKGKAHLDPADIEKGTYESAVNDPSLTDGSATSVSSASSEAPSGAPGSDASGSVNGAEQSASQLAAPANGESGGTMQHILVVDDEEDIRLYLQQELSEHYRVDICSNGKEAFEFLVKTPVDLVVSDVMMPLMNGNVLCRRIKKHPQLNHIPVILLTAKAQSDDRVEGMNCGADSFITKPFNVDVLRSTISNLIDNRRVLRNKFSGAQEQEDKVQPVQVRPVDDKFMEKVMESINAHMADPEFNVEALCEDLGLSRVHVHRKLKEITNLPTANFIKQVRLQQAARLLTEEERLNVSEVAYAVGYSNLSNFSVAFREMYGVSPKEYQKAEKKE